MKTDVAQLREQIQKGMVNDALSGISDVELKIEATREAADELFFDPKTGTLEVVKKGDVSSIPKLKPNPVTGVFDGWEGKET
jgi:hypothetical protein